MNDLSLRIYHAYNRIPAGNYMFKVNNRNTRTRYEICPMLTIKTPERRHLCGASKSKVIIKLFEASQTWHRPSVFIINFDHIAHLVLVFLLLILSR